MAGQWRIQLEKVSKHRPTYYFPAAFLQRLIDPLLPARAVGLEEIQHVAVDAQLTCSLAPGTAGVSGGSSAVLAVAALKACSARARASGGTGPRAMRRLYHAPTSAKNRRRDIAWRRAAPARTNEKIMHRFVTLALFIALVLGGGILIGVLTPPGAWYAALAKPPFNPPGWVFAPAWTLLYILIAVAGWRTWQCGPRNTAMAVWFVQLALNFHLVASVLRRAPSRRRAGRGGGAAGDDRRLHRNALAARPRHRAAVRALCGLGGVRHAAQRRDLGSQLSRSKAPHPARGFQALATLSP